MSKINSALDEAVVQGIVSAQQGAALASLFAARGLVAGDFSLPRDSEPAQAGNDSEAPRFLRGFHDILITIGVVAALTGLWGFVETALAPAGAIGASLAVLTAIFILAEFLVRRQRLALPAFVLTGFTLVAAGYLANALQGAAKLNAGDEATISIMALAAFGALALSYWRYKVPAALAAMIAAALAAGFMALLALIGAFNAGGEFEPRVVALLALLFALGLFGAAMRFDLADKNRVTRHSDVAFWLHLIAAPALLYSAFSLVFGIDGFGGSEGPAPKAGAALLALAIIGLLMVAGIIIDRRAFVTSGLISLGIALYALFSRAGVTWSSLTPFVLLMVGITVLLLGTGWAWLCQLLLAVLPQSLRDRLPPAV